MIILRDVKKEIAMRVPETPSIIHEMSGNHIDISIADDALASVEYKKDLLLISFDLDYCIDYDLDWIIGFRKYDFTCVELY